MFEQALDRRAAQPSDLVTNEIPLSIVHAVKSGPFDDRAQSRPRGGSAREAVDGAGGSSVNALNDLYKTAKAENVVPLELLTGAKQRRNAPTNAPITTFDI